MHLAQAQPIHYLPVATTALSLIFLLVLLNRYRMRRSGPHLLWWAAGIAAYGLGTALESAITLSGNTVALTKAWYIAGALLGGYPLAQGTVYLLLARRTAHVLSAITVPFIIAAAALVVFSPVHEELLEAHRPSGAILGWQWVRLLTPFINLYAVVFLVGGAIYSAARYFVRGDAMNRALGNSLIAVGAILPGVGGTMAKAGMVEGLYAGEFIGLLLIWSGYAACVREPRPARASSDTGIVPVRMAQDEPRP